MEITATEFKTNLGKYLDTAGREDVVITKNGKAVARLVGEREYRAGAAELDKLLLLREMPAGELYDSGASSIMPFGIGSAGSTGGAKSMDLGAGEWVLMHDGEPVARLTPIPKKKKRRLGFIKGEGAGQDEIDGIFESEWTEEDEEEWLNKW
jgi:prevent-host-death family protein